MKEPQKIEFLFKNLIKADLQDFPNRGKLNVTCNKGVYIIYNSNEEVVHVGRTPYGKDGLCQRLNDHIYGRSSFARNFLKPNKLSIRKGFSFKILEVSSARERTLLEALTCGLLCPKYIGTGEKNNSK